MPPIRTTPLGIPIKPVKTERTHEENQERAYIAASRRSDRSLEARIESARRASEIHKKRTGRALRVTEQDVINEEMYEEEDDDLPSQYRRIMQAIPITPDQPFNRKLQAWFLAQHATRAALLQNEQSVNNLWAQQYPNAPHFAHYTAPQQYAPAMSGQSVPRSPQNFRHQPYPTNTQGYKPHVHQRAASIATTQDFSNMSMAFARPNVGTPAVTPGMDTSTPEEHRRMSMPAVSLSSTPQPQHSTAAQVRPSLSRTPSGQGMSAYDPLSTQNYSTNMPTQQVGTPFQFHLQMPSSDAANRSFSPFSPTLPLDAQQMFGYDNADFFSQQPMTASHTLPENTASMFSYDLHSSPMDFKNMHAGHSQTLAPGALDTSVNNVPSMWSSSAPSSAVTAGMHSAIDSPFAGYGFDSAAGFADLNKSPTAGLGSSGSRGSKTNSASGTPSADAAWTGFLEGWTTGEGDISST